MRLRDSPNRCVDVLVVCVCNVIIVCSCVWLPTIHIHASKPSTCQRVPINRLSTNPSLHHPSSIHGLSLPLAFIHSFIHPLHPFSRGKCVYHVRRSIYRFRIIFCRTHSPSSSSIPSRAWIIISIRYWLRYSTRYIRGTIKSTFSFFAFVCFVGDTDWYL